VEDKGECQCQERVKPEQGRKAEEDAHCERRGSALWRIRDVQQRVQPAPNQRFGQVNHWKCLNAGSGRGASMVSPPRLRRSTTVRSSVQRPMRVTGTSAARAAWTKRRLERGRTVVRSS